MGKTLENVDNKEKKRFKLCTSPRETFWCEFSLVRCLWLHRVGCNRIWMHTVATICNGGDFTSAYHSPELCGLRAIVPAVPWARDTLPPGILVTLFLNFIQVAAPMPPLSESVLYNSAHLYLSRNPLPCAFFMVIMYVCIVLNRDLAMLYLFNICRLLPDSCKEACCAPGFFQVIVHVGELSSKSILCPVLATIMFSSPLLETHSFRVGRPLSLRPLGLAHSLAEIVKPPTCLPESLTHYNQVCSPGSSASHPQKCPLPNSSLPPTDTNPAGPLWHLFPLGLEGPRR